MRTNPKAAFPRETSTGGEFKRQASRFREVLSSDASSPLRSEPGRYHLYVSLACPWAHRIVIARELLGIQDVLSMTVVDPIRDDLGWRFTEEPDPNEGFEYLQQAYRQSDPAFDGRVTVPVLWDKKTKSIVNNESSDILRMLNEAFRTSDTDLYPNDLRTEIDRWNDRIYPTINNGVYRAGFATTQEAYEQAVVPLFAMLEEIDATLEDRDFLTGTKPTEADWRLFTTLIRFDVVYHGHFKCNIRRIADHKNLSRYLHSLYHLPGVAETVNWDHIKRHYYQTHLAINPTGIVPMGPELNMNRSHDHG